MTPEQRRHRAAHAFADRGWHVQPLVPGTSRPMSCDMCWADSPRYVPHRGIDDCPHPPDYCHSFYAATVDHARIESWFARFPAANVGIATGASGLVVVDCDSAAHGPITDPEWQIDGIRDGMDVFAAILERWGAPWPGTMQVWTPRDGTHFYWALPPGIAVKSVGGRFGPSIDVKASGAFIVAPTSSKPEGDYERIGDVTDAAPAPPWLMDHLDATGHIPKRHDGARTARRAPIRALNDGRRYVVRAVELELDAVATCGANRNDQLARSAFALGQFVGAGLLDQHDVHEALTAAAEHAGISPSERKAQDTIRRGLDAGSHQPRTIPTGARA